MAERRDDRICVGIAWTHRRNILPGGPNDYDTQQRISLLWRASEMSVQHRIFASSTKAWEALSAEASAFASEIGREKLINISVAASGGTEWFGRGGSGVIVVWYWE